MSLYGSNNGWPHNQIFLFRPDVEPPQGPQGGHHAPAMMTFKQFLNAQDDNIGDEEAFNKYQEYKLEFRKTQMSDFFQQHKGEEWYDFALLVYCICVV